MTQQITQTQTEQLICSSLGREVLRMLGIEEGSVFVSLLRSGVVLVEKEGKMENAAST